mmetsp:Transcript_89545/g.191882  ORF Transcript_89545/g.191882 Transcript_89545/m.191882 type:complete len:374 (-) Transcript_89545:42-1163(-)
MGCGASAKPAAAPEPNKHAGSQLRSVIVWGAKGLRLADVIGQNDAYCVARVGPKGSTWDEKLRGSGRRSQVSGSADPEWRLGFSTNVADMESPELHVRVYDADWVGWDDFLGEATAPLSELDVSPTALALSGDRAKGSLSVSAGDVDLLASQGITPSGFFEKMAPMGQMKSVRVEDITSAGPLTLGTAPLPEVMQGIFWLTAQGRSSALASFGGPTRDGGGCSPGQLADGRYDVRVAGDRVWAFADPEYLSWKFVEAVDLVYHFIFDDTLSPKKVQIYPEARVLDVTLTAEWLLDFEGDLAEGGDERWPGSVVWKRPSKVLGKEVSAYDLVQVMNGNGERIEPAWSDFVKYQNSEEAGNRPGEVFYHEINTSE